MTTVGSSPSEPLGLRFYRLASRASGPVARILLQRRLKSGKEDLARIGERIGAAGRGRPEGALAWIHGASVGESLSVLPLVERLKSRRPDLHFLVTTGTVTSARLMAERLPAGAMHQFAPVDHPGYVASFLDHWRPEAAIFVESEFWPNLILEARKRARLLALVNGRISPRSFGEWSGRPRTIRYLLSQFDMLIAQDRENAARLTRLSGRAAPSFGNLKNAAAPLPADETALAAIADDIAGRPIWLAASTHPGEEESIFAAHHALKGEFPHLLTILAPRHPERGGEVRNLAMASNLTAQQRSIGGPIDRDTDVYLADTLGELGIFYRLTSIAFVGGSLTAKGGHNPLEPARLGVAILHGPNVFNFVETYADMRNGGGSALVRNDRELATAVRRLLTDAKTRAVMTGAARNAAEASGERVLDEVAGEILSRLNAEKLAA